MSKENTQNIYTVTNGPSFKDFFFRSYLFGNSQTTHFTLGDKKDEGDEEVVFILITGIIKRSPNGYNILGNADDTYVFTGEYSPHIAMSTDPTQYVYGVYNTKTRKGNITKYLTDDELKSISLHELLVGQ